MAQQFINVLTGGTSGVYYPLGVAIGKIYGDKIPGVKTQVQATKASVENLVLLQQGRGEIAFTLGDSLKAAWDGDEEAGFKSKLDKLRTIGAIYPNYIQIVATADSGIRTLADLKGKSLSVGAPKSGTELNSRAILGAAGLSYKDIGKVEYLPFAESVDLMKNRQLNATLQSAGLGVASLKDLSNSTEITVVSVPRAVVDRIGPPFVAATIPANTYTGQDKDVPTAAVINYLVTSSAVSGRSRLPDDQADLRVAAGTRRMPTPPAGRSSSQPRRRAARCRCIRARSAITGKRVFLNSRSIFGVMAGSSARRCAWPVIGPRRATMPYAVENLRAYGRGQCHDDECV